MRITSVPKGQILTILVLLLSMAGTAAAATGQSAGNEAKPAAAQEKAKAAAPSGADGDYVGSETCITCHEDQQRRFKNTVMGKLQDAGL